MTDNKRDYKAEYERRKGKVKRLHADMRRDKAEALIEILDKRGQTFINWLEIQIENEIKRAL